jgi:predicted Holliday junction resolvase-like endonuclease
MVAFFGFIIFIASIGAKEQLKDIREYKKRKEAAKRAEEERLRAERYAAYLKEEEEEAKRIAEMELRNSIHERFNKGEKITLVEWEILSGKKRNV